LGIVGKIGLGKRKEWVPGLVEDAKGIRRRGEESEKGGNIKEPRDPGRRVKSIVKKPEGVS